MSETHSRATGAGPVAIDRKGSPPMPVDELQEENARPSGLFPVAPVVTRNVVPRGVVVAIVVGVVGFLAGIQVGAGGTAERDRSSVPPPTSHPASPTAEATPAVPATPPPDSAPPGSSAFVRDFAPADLVAGLAGGSECATSSGQEEVPRTRRDGSRLTFVRSWMTFCSLEVERRQAFLVALVDGLVDQVPSETYGYSTAVHGSGEALFPYAERPFVGTVTLSAAAAGPGFEIVITLEERLAE